MLVTKDPTLVFNQFPANALIVTEEPDFAQYPDAASQAESWGWKPGNRHTQPINSSVVRATAVHLPLLKRWREALTEPRYVQMQSQPFAERPRHMLSDQDVLFSLLGSYDFRNIPVVVLKGGIDVIHWACDCLVLENRYQPFCTRLLVIHGGFYQILIDSVIPSGFLSTEVFCRKHRRMFVKHVNIVKSSTCQCLGSIGKLFWAEH